MLLIESSGNVVNFVLMLHSTENGFSFLLLRILEEIIFSQIYFTQGNSDIALSKRSVLWRLKGFNIFRMLDVLKHFHKLLLIILYIHLNIL